MMQSMQNPSRITKVLEFLQVFEQSAFQAGAWTEPVSAEPGVLVMPSLNYDEKVSSFIQACYDAGLILKKFDWSAWVDEAMSCVDRPERLDGASFETIRKLLTVHIRGERFTEGHLLKMFEDGHIVRLLRRLEELGGESGGCKPAMGNETVEL